MSTLNDKLNLIKDARDDIQTALAGKGQVVGKDIRDYAEAVANIEGGSGDVKLFDTVEHMQQDETAQEGDLAVVYREEIQPVTGESEFDSCIFPNEVVLSEAFTDSISGMFRAVDDSWFDGMVDMSSSNFRFDGWGESSQIRVQYTSQDGITYTRTDGGEELQEFGTTIKWGNYEPFNSVIGNFMKIGGNVYEGLYEYGPFARNIVAFNTENIDTSTSPYVTITNTEIKVKIDILDKCCKAVRRYLCGGDNYIFQGDFYLTFDLKNIIYVGNYSSSLNRYVSIRQLFMNIANNKIYLPISSNRSDLRDTNNKILNYNIKNETITEITLQGDTTFVDVNSNSYSCKEFNGYFLTPNSYNNYTINWITNNSNLYNYLNWENNNSKQVQLKEINTSIYVLTKSQLDATPDYVYEKTFYGKNGIETGALQAGVVYNDTIKNIYINIANMFTDTGLVIRDDVRLSNLSYTELPFKIDTSTMTNMYNMFYNCTNLTTIPLLDTSNVTNMYNMFNECTSLTTIPLLDTSNVTDMGSMFNDCTSLITIPLIDTSNATNMRAMFNYCTNLTSIPLLDISSSIDVSYMFNKCTSLTTIPLLDTSSVTNMSDMFNYCTSLTTIPLLDTSNVTNMYEMFCNCTSLTTIPLLDTSNVTDMQIMFSNCTSLTTIPLLDTSSVTNMYSMFYRCTSLTTVPQLDTSNATMYDTFNGCTSLNNDSLNNILAMCANATKMTFNKTLRHIGLTQAQATICQGLSNYSAFTSAGWTTGY